jgi:DNA-binding CsgD family transcriptional regulator
MTDNVQEMPFSAEAQSDRASPSGRIPGARRTISGPEHPFWTAAADLPAATRSLLEIAALDDGIVWAEIVAVSRMLGRPEPSTSDLNPAVTLGLIDTVNGQNIRFRPPLVRSALGQPASTSQRRRLHAALAHVLRSQPDRAVWHRAAAAGTSPDDETATDLASAAARARRRGDLYWTANGFERAATLSTSATRRASWSLQAALATFELGDEAATKRLVVTISDADLPAADQARLSWLRENSGSSGWTGASQLPAFIDIADRMRRNGDSDLALDSLITISLRFFWSNPSRKTREQLLLVADDLDVSPLDPRLISLLAQTVPTERGADVLDRLVQLGPFLCDDAERLHLLGIGALAVGDVALARMYLAAAVDRIRDQGRLGLLAKALITSARASVQVGATRNAITEAAEGGQLAKESGQPMWAVTASITMAEALAMRGDRPAALPLIDDVEAALVSQGPQPMLALVQLARGLDALAAGQHTEGFEHLSRIFDRSDVAYHPHVRFWALGHLAESGVACGRADEVRSLVGTLTAIAHATHSPLQAVALTYAGTLLAHPSEADETFQAALATDLASWPFERARIQLAYGAWLRRQRRPAASRPHLRAAGSTFDALGATPWAERVRRELRAAGGAVRHTSDAANELTPQELEVAQLAAAGLSNREIAAKLYISPRTVTTHLYRIYPKVGVSSRTELARVIGPLA